MRIVDTFIPIDRRFALARGESLPDRLAGTALCADISGFTPLTEVLARLFGSQRGPEEITAHVNRVYDTLIAEVDNFGGSVIGFSGDAITCWFQDDPSYVPDGRGTQSATPRAITCGLAMQKALRQFATGLSSRQEAVPFNVKVAITAGPVRRFRVGDPAIRYMDVIAGATLDRLASTERNAQQGRVVVDAETASQLSDIIQVSAWNNDGAQRFAVVKGLSVEVTARPWPSLPAGALSEEHIRPWLLPFVYERLRSGVVEFLAELRPVVALFNRFSGINYDADDAAGEKLDDYIRWVQSVLARYEGTLFDLTIGDKGSYLFAALGVPLAHDDDMLRAIAAARELRSPPPHLKYITRLQIGITRGRMRVGPFGGTTRHTYGAIGNEMNVAARLMEQAAPGQIIVSKTVAHATSHRYQFRALGAIKVKGRTEPVDIFGLLGLRAEPASVGGVSTPERRRAPMVARTAERTVLRELLERLLYERRGGTVLIEGEAGIGKSRLVEDLFEQARAAGATCLLAAGDAVEQATVYYPWRSVFAQLFELDTLPDAPGIRREHVVSLFESNPEERDLAPLLNVVLPLNLPDNETTTALTGRVRAETTRDLLARILRRKLRAAPLLIVIEDAHWLDSASWALVDRVAALHGPILFVLATRPLGDSAPSEFQALVTAPGTQQLKLEPLKPDDVLALVQQRLAVHSVPERVIEFIQEKAEGNPFFSEELAYALRDSGVIVLRHGAYDLAPDAPDLRTLNFPDTVEGVITSRIDRLTPSQQLTIKVASVIGRIFAYLVLREIYPVSVDMPHLSQDLDTLARSDLTLLESPEPDLRYIFKHIITQEVAYNLMLYAQRRQLHRAVAEWYERTFVAELAQHYPILSYHWTKYVEVPPSEPAYVMKAIDYLRKAGQQAAQSNANHEAIGFYHQALELITTLPESVDRIRLELAVLLGLAPPLIATKGYGDTVVEHNFSRALAICNQLGPVPQLFSVLMGLQFYYMVRVDLRTAGELADRLYAIAQEQQEPALFHAAANALIAAALFSGEVNRVPAYLQVTAEPLTLEQQLAMATQYGHNPTMACFAIAGLALWALGYPDQALAKSQQALSLAQAISHHYSRAYASHFLSSVYCLRREVERTRETSEATIAIAKKFGFPVWIANAMVYPGWSLAMQGQGDAGIKGIRQGISMLRSIQIDLAIPYYLGLLADVYLKLQQTDEGLNTVEQALSEAHKTGELWMEPELHRLKGELLLTQRVAEESQAEAQFRQAIEIAQQHQAKSWELRALTSLVRLLQRQDRAAAARARLLELYSWFTEGFETADLQEARTLLQE